MKDMKQTDKKIEFIEQILLAYGVSVICLNVFCMLLGERTQATSTLFSLGGRGLGSATLWQVFLMDVLIVATRYLFFTHIIIKNASVGVRTVGGFAMMFLLLAAFVLMFGWFPADNWKSWTGCILSYAVGAAVGTVVSVREEKQKNRKMEEALERLKREEGER